MQCELKVLAGTHGGARASLAQGRTIIGGADDCDIVLVGDDVAAHHAAVVVEGDAIRVAPMEGEVIRADASLVHDEETLAPFEPIGLGSAVIAVGAAGAAWPKIDLAQFGRAPAGASGQSAAPGAEPRLRLESGAAAPTRAGDSDSRSHRGTVFPLTVLLLAGVGFAGWTLYEQNKAEEPGGAVAMAAPAVEPSPLKLVSDKLAGLAPAGQLSARLVGDRTVLVTGYVELEEQKRLLNRELAVDNVRIVTRIWAQEELVREARSRVASIAPALAVKGTGPGAVRVSGVVPDGDLKSRVLLAAREDVPGLREVGDGILTRDQAASRLTELIERSPLAGRITVAPTDQGLTARGSVGEKDLAVWRSVTESFSASVGAGLPIVTAFSPRSEDLPFVIRSIVVGPLPYVMTTTGRKVTEGGFLADGFEVVKISTDHVTIRHKDQTFAQRIKD